MSTVPETLVVFLYKTDVWLPCVIEFEVVFLDGFPKPKYYILIHISMMVPHAKLPEGSTVMYIQQYFLPLTFTD